MLIAHTALCCAQANKKWSYERPAFREAEKQSPLADWGERVPRWPRVPHSLGRPVRRDLATVFVSAESASEDTVGWATESLRPPPESRWAVGKSSGTSETADTNLHRCLQAWEPIWKVPHSFPVEHIHHCCDFHVEFCCQQTSQGCKLHVLSYLKPVFSMLCFSSAWPQRQICDIPVEHGFTLRCQNPLLHWGREGVSEFITGSTSEQCMEGTDCPYKTAVRAEEVKSWHQLFIIQPPFLP